MFLDKESNIAKIPKKKKNLISENIFKGRKNIKIQNTKLKRKNEHTHKPNTIYHYGLFPSRVFPYVYFSKNAKDYSMNMSLPCAVVIINIIASD